MTQSFAPLVAPIGFYPVVPTAEWVVRLLSWGVRTIQLRIKAADHTPEQIATEVMAAIAAGAAVADSAGADAGCAWAGDQSKVSPSAKAAIRLVRRFVIVGSPGYSKLKVGLRLSLGPRLARPKRSPQVNC